MVQKKGPHKWLEIIGFWREKSVYTSRVYAQNEPLKWTPICSATLPLPSYLKLHSMRNSPWLVDVTKPKNMAQPPGFLSVTYLHDVGGPAHRRRDT